MTKASPILFSSLLTHYLYLNGSYSEYTGRGSVLLGFQDVAGTFGALLFMGYFAVGGRRHRPDAFAADPAKAGGDLILQPSQEAAHLCLLLLAPPAVHMATFDVKDSYPGVLFGLQVRASGSEATMLHEHLLLYIIDTSPSRLASLLLTPPPLPLAAASAGEAPGPIWEADAHGRPSPAPVVRPGPRSRRRLLPRLCPPAGDNGHI